MEVPMTLRPALLFGCALGAFSLSGEARAQAFNADPTTVSGSVGYDRGTPGVETIRIDSQSAIINWVPNVGGSPIIFLPAGNVATFTNGVSNSDFAVLNRIQTDQPVRFDGTVISQLQDFAVGTSRPGGTVIFQGPGGIIVGPTALFDVGNLVLTTLIVADDGTGNFIDSTGAIQFAGGFKAPNAAVITLPGSQIRALEENSYVALIAPVVQHGGSVRVNGSAAFVAGEEVQIRVNAGLFDIIVTAGSDNAVPLIHTGSTGGPASSGAGDNHGIYLVAVPKNQAITAILEGNVGFDPAINAAIENGAIVLSAGYAVVGGVPDRFGDFGVEPVPGLGASFHIRGGTITSDLFGFAVTDMLASGATTGSLVFQQDVSLFGGAHAHLFAGQGQTVTVGGNALVSAANNRTLEFGPIDLAGGEALIFSQGGTLDIIGNATVDASAQGVVNVVTSIAGNGTGGNAGIFADTGSVRVRGATRILATGAGGALDLSPDRGGAGVGGNARVEGINGGLVRLDGDLAMDASGTGSQSNGSVNPGANGTGGDVRVAAVGGGRVMVGGAPTLTSNGTGGIVTGGTVFAGGTGRGGTVSLLANGIVTFAGNPILTADGAGGAGPTGGIALGGTINLAATPVAGGSGVSMLGAGNVTGTASAAGAAAGGNSPGAWHVTATGGSNIKLDNLILTAAVNGTPATLPFSSIEPRGGFISVGQLATLVTPGEIRVIGDGAGTITGGRFDLDAGGDVIVTHNARGANSTIDVTDLDIDGANVTVAAGAATRASNRTNVAARAVMTVGGQMDGREIVITSSAAGVLAGGRVGGAATELADIRATNAASVAGTVLGRAINLQGATITVAGTGIIGGAATDQTRLTALGNAAIAGRVLGRDIQIASADLDLTGALGDAATQIATLQVNPTTQATTLGGAAQGPGYTLTNAEAGRIRADALQINVPALGANVALFVRDLAFTGGGAAAGIGGLIIATPGIARVEGNLAMTGARAADGIAITAVERLEVVTPGGSIRVRGAAGAPAGRMILTSNNLWVASSAIIDRLRLDPNYAGRDADLLDNGGADVPRGYVEADGVTLTTGGTLFVQNTGFGMGTFATGLDFAGVTVGPGGLIVIANAPASRVTAFGRRLNADGTYTTGYDFFFDVDFRTGGGAAGGAGGGYAAASTFNTCIIVTRQCAAQPPDNSVPGRDPTTGPTGGSASIQLPFAAAEDDLVDTSFAAEPLIEEPVTSGGESTLWDPDCDRDHDGDCDEVHP
jgi:filamentous hemagglutinin family protein